LLQPKKNIYAGLTNHGIKLTRKRDEIL